MILSFRRVAEGRGGVMCCVTDSETSLRDAACSREVCSEGDS